jgi:hypothetical protein
MFGALLWAAAVATPQPHSLRLGFNVGYLSDGAKYANALSTLRADGLLQHLRFMGAWMHPNGSATSRTSAWTSSLLSEYLGELGDGASATITLSNFPFDVQPDFLTDASKYLTAWVGQPATALLADSLSYTNRAPPTRGAWILRSEDPQAAALTAYGREVASLRQLLATTSDLAGRVDVEVGNEPNALKYFWGASAEWAPIADTALGALDSSSRLLQSPVGGRRRALSPRVLCCAFTTSLSAQRGVSGGTSSWGRYAQNESRRASLSFHFYRQCTNGANVNRSTYANASAFFGAAALNGSVLTEWGLFTYNSNTTEDAINSPRLTLELARLLRWCHTFRIAEVDAHCLMDDPSKRGHNCYFDRLGNPKAAYHALLRVARIVRGGYVATFDRRFNLTTITSAGAGSSITNTTRLVAAAGGYDGEGVASAPFELNATRRDRVIAASNFSYNGVTLPAGQWLVVESAAAVDIRDDIV